MENIEALIDRVEKLIELDAQEELRELINELNISEMAEIIDEFPKFAYAFFKQLDFQRALAVFRILETNQQKRMLNELQPYQVAQLINELPADDRTSFLSELNSNAVKELLKLLDPEERKISLSLLGYPEDSVGRLMTPDYIDVEPDWSVEQVLNFIRDYGKSSETIDVIYVTDENGVLLDDIRIRDFLLVDPKKTLVKDLMDGRDSISLNVNNDQAQTLSVFQNNNRVALPVVDEKNILLGIVTIDDVLWVAEEEYSEDIQMIGGTEALDDDYLEVSLLHLYKKRIVWLVLLFFGGLLTIAAMKSFENEISKLVILATFIPIIISSGGNSGSQSATLIIQAMALNDVSIKDWWRIMKRELVSGFLLGFTLCVLGIASLLIWNLFFPTFGENIFRLALVIGFSLLSVVLWGSLLGSMLPIFLKRLGADPAAASTPFVATLADVSGLLIYFSISILLLKGILL